jgi:RNA polymerase sigma factor (sigma-70 family)
MPWALRLSYLLTGERGSAEDLAQEAFIRAASRLRFQHKIESFDGYLRRTIVNLHVSWLRRRRTERRHLERMKAWAVTESTMPDLETRDELIRALRQLPARQRAAVVLRHL